MNNGNNIPASSPSPSAIDLTEDEPAERQRSSNNNGVGTKRQLEQAQQGSSRAGVLAQANAVRAASRHAKAVPLATAAAGHKRGRSGAARSTEPIVLIESSEDEEDRDTDMLGGGQQQQRPPAKKQMLQQHTNAAACPSPKQREAAASRPDGSWPLPVQNPSSGPQPQQPEHSHQEHPQMDPQQQSGAGMLAMLAREREQRQRQQQQQQQSGAQHAAGVAPAPGAARGSHGGAAAEPGPSGSSRAPEVSILTFNLWFKEVALPERMRGVAAVIASCGYPDYVLLQEVTRDIVSLLSAMPWWTRYCSSVPPLPQQPYFTVLCARRDSVHLGSGIAVSPFLNSKMGRGLQYARTLVHGYPLLVATSHLESPVPKMGMFKEERTAQQRQAVEVLDTLGKADQCDVVLAGDLNWTDKRDGPPHLLPGWQDAWLGLRPGEPGLTYDTRGNPMLEGSWPGARLDRVLCRLGSCFEPLSIELVGTEALPDVKYVSRSGTQLPVLPSDHFGLLFKMRVRQGAKAVAMPSKPAALPGGGAGGSGEGVSGQMPFTGAGRVLGSG